MLLDAVQNRDCYRKIGKLRGKNEAGIGMLVDYCFWIFRDPIAGLRRSTGRRSRR
jgi:hypothetical protein